ncbi:SMC family ATPase [Pseudoglutamicibacter cumminsii]|uniref:Nuclease SbcCD subunit C n=1 Tax=Pseudoglutamicibacter cumminsii TaxID=156979 RepID=A0AAP4C5T2_9MICC|nr:SMC family ATPase [Pseudoglutamicibacter cumminsii]MDK6274340.1 SMC family ATPase [Pseudoglutamicibacter cumminsii]
MKLHSLTITAFGPFADTQTINFDELAGTGLFLLQGDTGAGKTTILDAVCFALYGKLPGARGELGANPPVRSSYAPDSVGASVELEFSIGVHRYRVKRSPSWDRPKLRGEGTTLEHAKAYVEQLIDGEWVSRGAKPADVNTFLDGDQGLLGLSLDQFTRVAMLPQGEFAQFLKSNTNERDQLLSTLFDVSLYENLQRVANEHSKQLEAQTRETEQAFERSLDKLEGLALRYELGSPESEVAQAQTPERDATEHDVEWGRSLTRTALQRVEQRKEAHQVALGRYEEARQQLSQLETVVSDAKEYEKYKLIRTELVDTQASAEQKRHSLKQHELASEAQRFLSAEEKASRAVDKLNAAFQNARAELPGALPVEQPNNAYPYAKLALRGDEASGIEASEVDAQAETEAISQPVEAFVAWELAIKQADTLHRKLITSQEACKASALALRRAHTDYEQRQAQAELARKDLAEAQIQRENALETKNSCEIPEEGSELLQERLKKLSEQAAAARKVEEAEAAYTAAHQRSGTTQKTLDEARKRESDLYTRRQAHLVASLAQDLTPGQPCSVCGATQHPAPAPHTQATQQLATETTAVSERDIEQAQHERQRAERANDEAHNQARQSYEQLSEARATAGGRSLEQAQTSIDELTQKLQRVRQQEDTLIRAENAVNAAEKAMGDSRNRLEYADTESKTSREKLDATQKEDEQRRAEQQSLLGDWDSIETLRAALESFSEYMRRCIDLHTRTVESQAALNEIRTEAETYLSKHGITRAEVTSHLLDEEQATLLKKDVKQREELEARCKALAMLGAVQRASQRIEESIATPSEEQLAEQRTRLTALEELKDAALKAHNDAEHAHENIQEIFQELCEADSRRGELGAEAQRAKSIAAALNGTGGENLKSMSIRAYVLAARLEAVAEAATHRLNVLSDGRYRILHDDAKSRNRKAGLDLIVEDSWNSTVRPTATLSGGETFLVSLALALGLADIVQEETGGITIETLFVDEGFGTLDKETLDKAMSGIDRLRQDGRMIGIVSHVEELRSQIPDQIYVKKTRNGSSVKVITADQPAT